MLWTIILREILEYIKSLKFLIGIGVTVLLVATATYISTRDYARRQQDYLDARPEKKGVYLDLLVYRPPELLSILAQGKDGILGNQASINEYYIPVRTTGYFSQQSRHSLLHDEFTEVDFAFVVRVVLSLLVIFLAYNAVSEEKVRGTLRLIIANSLPRHTILLGKFLGGLIVIMVSLTVAAIISLLLMLSQSTVAIGSGEWMRIGAIYGVSALYLTTIFTMSLLVSVLVSRPSTALGILLQAWVILLFVYPNFAVFIADSSYALPDGRKLAEMRVTALARYKEGKDPRFKVANQQAEAMYTVDHMYSNELSLQAARARNLAILSPAVLFDEAVNRFARTGIESHDRFMQDLHHYWENHLHFSDIDIKNDSIDELANRKYEIPFTSTPDPFTKSVMGALRYILIMVFSGIVFFVGAYSAFLRKDVR